MVNKQCFLDIFRFLCPILTQRTRHYRLNQDRYTAEGEPTGKEFRYRNLVRGIEHRGGGTARFQCVSRKPQSGETSMVGFFEGQCPRTREVEPRRGAVEPDRPGKAISNRYPHVRAA